MTIRMKRWTAFLIGNLVLSILFVSPRNTYAAADDPKCVFLRHEAERVRVSPSPVPDHIPAGIRPEYGRYATEVNVNLLEGKIDSCDKKEKLSSLSRLRLLEATRLAHIDRIRKELPGVTASGVIEAVNTLYEQEARSFYNYETQKLPMIDRDVIKDFPMLLDLVKGSSLPDDLKTSFSQNFRFIKYEEAGQLQNGLRGINKDLGTTFVYLLRSDLSDRAAADAEKLKQAEKDRLEKEKISTQAQADAVQRTKITARITVSISALVVMALIGFILIRREVVAFPIWLNVLEVSGCILLGWVLIGMGLLTWLSDYVGLAF